MSDIIELSSDSSHQYSPQSITSDCLLNTDVCMPLPTKPGDCKNSNLPLSPTCSSPAALSDDVRPWSPGIFDPGDFNVGANINDVIPTASGTKYHHMSDSESDTEDIDEFPNQSIFNNLLVDELTSSQSNLPSTEEFLLSSQSSQSPQKKRTRNLSQEEREVLRLEKEKAKEEKAKAREEKQKEKELRDKEKKEKKSKNSQLKRLRPGECVQYMSVTVDDKLYNTVLFEKCVEVFPLQDVNFICKDLPFENTILWTRREEGGEIREEGVVAVMYDVDKVAELIKTASLIESLKQLSTCYPGKQVSLWIFTLDLYYRKSKNSQYRSLRRDQESGETGVTVGRKAKEYLTREEMEMGLTELQILTGISYRSFETFNDLSNLLYQFTKSIAETPFRLEREKLDRRMAWFNRGESRDCIRIDKDMNGLSRLWSRHLAQFNNANVETVNAITALYPTPQALMQAYDKCSSNKEKEKLLQDLQVIRNASASAATRKLGPKLSLRVCTMYTSVDSSLLLSQEAKEK